MAITDDIKTGLSFLRGLRSKAADHKEDILKVAENLETFSVALKGLANGDPQKLDAVMTRWVEVNKTLLAISSAKQELTRKEINWTAISDGLLVAIKVGIRIATLL